MPEKPATAEEYSGEQLELVRATCLHVATKLGDLMDDLVIVGGLVPSLLIEQATLPEGTEAHAGTVDLDVGLAVAVLKRERYQTLTERLRSAGFQQDINDQGNPTRQRWKIEGVEKVTVDFLIPPSGPDDHGGDIRNIQADFAAIIAPGLHLAFQDRQRLTLTGKTIMGETATRDVWVCGPGAFVVLKALAFDSRGENKDGYDAYYVIRNYGSGVGDVADRLIPFRDDEGAKRALTILARDFADNDAVGPRRVAEFLVGAPDADIQADVVGFVDELLRRMTAT